MSRIEKQKPTNMNIASKPTIVIILAAIFLTPIELLALDLSSAKSDGLIGETDSGYLAVVDSDDPSLNNFVKNINEKRRLRYQMIANKNSVPLSAVAQQAGRKLIRKMLNGEYVRISGKWQKNSGFARLYQY